MKIDHENDGVAEEKIDEQENIKDYVMDMVTTISDNAGEREFSFKTGEETMKLYINSLMEKEDKDEKYKIVENIAKRLLSKEKDAQTRYAHITQIQKGIMLVALCKMTERDYKIIISKADYSEFLEESSGEKKNGLPTKKKIFKSFIANITKVGDAFDISKMLTFDVNSSQAKYWYNDFLDLEAKLDDESNTVKAFNEIKARLIEPIRKVSRQDYWCLYNLTLAYMRSEGDFDINYYANNVLDVYTPVSPKVNIGELKSKALELPEKRKFDKKFSKIPNAIKNKFKTTVPLTEDMSLSVNSNSPNLSKVITAYDNGVDKFIMIKSNEGYSFATSLNKG